MNGYPSAFLGRMYTLLDDEYIGFLKCTEQPSIHGIRLSLVRCDEKTLKNVLDFPIEISPLSPYPYYTPEDADKPGSIPLHHAGAFYSQKPSTASAITVLSPQLGEEILDLCATPGGKSTRITALPAGRGLLWSNEVVRSHAVAPLSNLECMGASNAVISSCHPELLCEVLSGFFDHVLVDVPCSEGGMFRRDAQAVQDRSEEHARMCAARQGLVLDSAANALREDGILVYSTCAFSPEEDGGTVRAFLPRHPDFILEDSGISFSKPRVGMSQAWRVFPMDGGGGHFVTKMRRTSPAACRAADYPFVKFSTEAGVKALCGQIFSTPLLYLLIQNDSSILTTPEFLPGLSGLGMIHVDVMFGGIQKGRIEPVHALFLSSLPHQLRQTIDFSFRSSEIRAYLYGEESEVDPALEGYTGVAVDSIMTGFGKYSSGKMKNRYPKGLRSHT